MDAAGIKWVAGYPANWQKELPQITGIQIMNDPETGLPLCIMDCRWITAVRTAAVTAIVAKHCARPDSKKVAIIGAGLARGSVHQKADKVITDHLGQALEYEKDGAFAGFLAKRVGLGWNQLESAYLS